ncbi:uncharacterized protein LOC133797663 [Humulus lupulus]|uniref:uncharacterized protein LOC133797663 n=1 Tax=Humulus lupulus TaxID=3486 RepID=UPI002B401DD2|nr:uncharacterized protein LOC133797663 [Humulus lupulus]
MLSFLHKPQFRIQRIILAFLNTNSNCAGGANVDGHRSSVPVLKSFSTLSPPTSSSPTVDYLITSLGISPELALAAAQTIGREPKPKSDDVIALFRRYGFSSDQIAEMFVKCSQLFWSDAVKTLEPKLQFLSDSGMSRENLILIVSTDPFLLKRSLENHISPCIRFLKSFYGGIDEVISLCLARRGTWVLRQFSEAMASNIETLRSQGVPDDNIVKMLEIRPRTLAQNENDFAELAKEAKRLGFDTSSSLFIHGMAILSGMKKDKWVSKMDVFKSLGWSEEQFRVLFVRQPQVMGASKDRLKMALEFFITKFQWGPSDFCKYPNILLFSFEKRILPRTSVLQILLSKRLIDKKSIGRAFFHSNDVFLKRCVEHHQPALPQLLDLFTITKVEEDVVCSGN